MTKRFYKYFPSDTLPLVFARDGYCGVKCSYPKDYNDPWELFLSVDLTLPPELLATYREIIQELPQHPTTCFSQSPTVAPMWAHYAQNHSGFVLEFDSMALIQRFGDAAIREITYRDNPDERLEQFLRRAAGTMKPRHAYFLQAAVLAAAYFSKHIAWSYEREVRLVDDSTHCENVAGNKILFLPISCVSAVITGRSMDAQAAELSQRLAHENGLRWYQSIIGKSKAEPFFKDRDGQVAVFDVDKIVPAKRTCKSCSEPVANRDHCAWCAITERHEINAASSNPFRLLERYGLLNQYYADADGIGRTE